MASHYEVRKTGSVKPEYRTGSNTSSEFDRACQHAKAMSAADPHACYGSAVRYEVRYRGLSEAARDLLVAAYQGGEQLDIRTQPKIDEDLSR